MKFQRVRGTKDLLPDDCKLHRFVEESARNCAQLYGYHEIQTPIFESTEVFHRTLGETSDAVNKETYTFVDRGGESITLRPEGTAGVARAFLSEGLAQNLPLKFFYCGPMFRYERPQKGRQRQFHQLGVECLGIESHQADVDMIAIAWRFLQMIGVQNKCRIEINTLGDTESRSRFREALVNYFSQFKEQLSKDSQIRLEKNPLRILDSKEDVDRKLIENAPSFEAYINDSSRIFFDNVVQGLKKLQIPFTINRQIVRGLDYYSHTVFEIITDQLGAQGTVLAGGRYDGLIETMGGPKTAGIGWAAGIERLSELTDKSLLPISKKTVAIVPADDTGESMACSLAEEIRNFQIPCETISGGNIGKKMKKADKMGATFALIIGESEIKSQLATVKNLKTGDQQKVPIKELGQYLSTIP